MTVAKTKFDILADERVGAYVQTKNKMAHMTDFMLNFLKGFTMYVESPKNYLRYEIEVNAARNTVVTMNHLLIPSDAKGGVVALNFKVTVSMDEANYVVTTVGGETEAGDRTTICTQADATLVYESIYQTLLLAIRSSSGDAD